MICPSCHTAGAYQYHRPVKVSSIERAPADGPIHEDVLLRLVKRPMGQGYWECKWCHYEVINDV